MKKYRERERGIFKNSNQYFGLFPIIPYTHIGDNTGVQPSLSLLTYLALFFIYMETIDEGHFNQGVFFLFVFWWYWGLNLVP
jgi:hypothetical protein